MSRAGGLSGWWRGAVLGSACFALPALAETCDTHLADGEQVFGAYLVEVADIRRIIFDGAPHVDEPEFLVRLDLATPNTDVCTDLATLELRMRGIMERLQTAIDHAEGGTRLCQGAALDSAIHALIRFRSAQTGFNQYQGFVESLLDACMG